MLRIFATLLLLAGCSSGADDGRGDAPGGDPTPGDPATSGCPPGSNDAICDTNLAGVGISWTGTLELCNYWNDNGDLTVEQERQVHLTVPPQPRASLTETDLSNAAMNGVRVRQGPFAAEQWHVASASTTLDSYDLTGSPDSSSLSAVLVHDLGAAGRLHEAYYVYRQPENSDPVDADAGGVSFTYFKAGQTQPQFAIHLRACHGADDYVELAQVLTGEDQVTGDQVTVLRTFRSRDPNAPSDGSYPVHFTGARVTLSTEAWQSHVATSYWSHTYAAEHHNWDEHSLIDFENNLSHYHTHFGPNRTWTGEAVREVELFHIAGFTPPQFIGVTYENVDTGAEREISFDVTEPWGWVGEVSLRAGYLDSVCPTDGEVFTVGWSDYQFQLATCPRAAAPGFDLIALVPLIFAHDMAQAGNAFTGSDITAITDGFSVDVDGSEVDIFRFNDTYLQLEVRDGAGANLHGSLVTPAELTLTDHTDELLRFEGGDVYAELHRRWAGQGVGESSIYAPIQFVLGFSGQVHFVEAWDRLDYTNTHHNWMDSLTAEDDTLRMFWRVAYESGPLAYYVRAETLAGVEVLADTAVTLLP